jgi:predicted ATPase
LLIVPILELFRGWAVARLGQIEKGLDEMRRAGSVLMYVALFKRVFFWGLADVYLASGRAPEGLEAVQRALADPGREYEAELRRLKGELLLLADQHSLVEATRCFLGAIEIARRQRAKSLELRATMSLARLLAQQGKREEARTMLVDIYNWFTEGFDTADLKDAKALLEELAA